VSGFGVSSPRISKAGYDPHDSSYRLSVKKLIIEALAKILNVHPPPTPPIKGGEHTPTPLSRRDLPSPLVGEGKGKGKG